MKKGIHLFSLLLLLVTYLVVPVTGIAQTQEIINQNSTQTTSPLNEEEKQFKNVSNLILKYASTLNNKDHSDNLFHKLILENRIKILPL